MVTLDLAHLSVREANRRLRELGAAGDDVEILNPDAKHHIGVGLVHPITVKVRGSAGYFCAGLTHGARFEIDSNVGWGVGDNIYDGTVIVGGNAGAVAGVAIRGAEVIIKGNMGSRAGQVMKAGTLLCCGNASFMAGTMMYGGRIVILGRSGERLGEDMTGGEIFVAGGIDSLGADAVETDISKTETDSILEFLERHKIPFQGHFSKVVNAGAKLRYTTPEPTLRNQPTTVAMAGGFWNAKTQEDIEVKAVTGRYRVRGYGTARAIPHFNDIAFRRDILPDEGAVSKVNLAMELGSRSGAKPLSLSMPVLIAPMSYGALSRSTKLALGIASRLSRIAENTGEGGMIQEERDEAGQLIFQCLSGRLGWNVRDMQKADAIEIYISQGAKPGLGGQLMASKVTPELASIRGIPPGIDLRSPSRHPDVLGADDLVIKIEEFREATGYAKPISVKLGAGRVKDDIKIAFKDGFDFVELDGLQGSTGAASAEVIEHVGIPTLAAIVEAIDALREVGARKNEMPIVLMGGIKDGVDAAKAIALGAGAVAVGTAALIAGGCISCMRCQAGYCVTGIATQNPEHEKRFRTDVEAHNIHRFLESMRWQLAAIVHGLGKTDVHQLCRDDLVALTPEAAAITGLPYEARS
ncbi:MAG: glutamate synthase-related protein [Rhodospirillales bacterium]|jgi:glutamate synthase domain-containing protein 2